MYYIVYLNIDDVVKPEGSVMKWEKYLQASAVLKYQGRVAYTRTGLQCTSQWIR